MNESLNPKVAAEKAGDSFRKAAARFEEIALPQAMRELAEKNITQMRETYEHSKDALEGVLQSWERSFDATNQGAVALNRKIMDIAQRNINSSFDLAKSSRRREEPGRGCGIAGALLAQTARYAGGSS